MYQVSNQKTFKCCKQVYEMLDRYITRLQMLYSLTQYINFTKVFFTLKISYSFTEYV